MKTSGERYDVGSDKGEAGSRLDQALVLAQAGALAEQLREEGRELAAQIVDQLRAHLGAALHRERAGAPGTINNGGKAVHGRGIAPPKGVKAPNGVNHKHTFSDDGVCHKLDGAGEPCLAKRQRKARAPKQTIIPGTNGAEAGAGA
jgi:hypothetical protein